MMRLYNRAIEIITSIHDDAKLTLFSDNGRLYIQYSRFKKSLHKIVKQNSIDLHDFASLFITFTRSIYRRQISKLKTYTKML